MAKNPNLPAADFGTFNKSSIEVDEENNVAHLTVYLSHGVTLTVAGPIPVITAWALDNAAGKLLAESGKLKA